MLSQITTDGGMQFLLAVLIGLIAGVLGGLAGVGGSMIMIPGLAMIFGYDDAAHSAQHVYMAAAMTVNVLVAIPAAWRHQRNGAMRRELVVGIMPAMVAAICAGVLISNVIEGSVLRLLLAIFIAGYAVLNLYRLAKPLQEDTRPMERIGRGRLTGIGGVGGLVAGLLGLGGGVVLVPMLQVVSHVRLRHAIAASSAVMAVSAIIGAGVKLGTLQSTHDRSPEEALLYVIAMAPGAVLGGVVGAQLAHVLPLRVVRAAVSLLLLIVAARLAGAGELLQ